MKFNDAMQFKEVIVERELKNEVRTEVVFSCKHCSRPTGYDTLEGVDEHIAQCLFKNDNKRCLMCKHLKIIEEAPYPKNNKLYKSVDTEWAFGSYRTPYCMKNEEILDEVEVHTYHDECFELGEEMPVLDKTEEYVEWFELSTELDDEWRVEEPDSPTVEDTKED